jgi:hypothetical protein
MLLIYPIVFPILTFTMTSLDINPPLRCPRCAFEWSVPDPHWDEFGACGCCGMLLAIGHVPFTLRRVTEEDLDGLAIEDRWRLYDHVLIKVMNFLRTSVPCSACGRTGAVECPIDFSKRVGIWNGISESLYCNVTIGPCMHCNVLLSVVRTPSGRFGLRHEGTDAEGPSLGDKRGS